MVPSEKESTLFEERHLLGICTEHDVPVSPYLQLEPSPIWTHGWYQTFYSRFSSVFPKWKLWYHWRLANQWLPRWSGSMWQCSPMDNTTIEMKQKVINTFDSYFADDNFCWCSQQLGLIDHVHTFKLIFQRWCISIQMSQEMGDKPL